MPWFSDDDAVTGDTAGIYRALLEREREGCARIDPRTLPRSDEGSAAPKTVVETGARSGALLAALETGEPARLEGRNLRRWVDLCRDQVLKWFEVHPDDTVMPFDVAARSDS